MTARKLLGVIAASIAGVMLFATTAPAGTNSQTAASRSGAAKGTVTIHLGNIKASVCTPLLLWQKFLPKNYRVSITYFTSPADQVAAMLTGGIDAVCTGVTIGVVAEARGEPVSIISNLATRGTAIVVGKNSGITSVAGLKGKTIAYTPDTIHEVLLRETLRNAGLNPDTDVKLQQYGLIDMPQALCSGAVDAFVGNEPNASIAVLRGCGKVLTYPYSNPVGTINVGVLAPTSLVQKNPRLVQTMVKANVQAVNYLRAHPKQIVSLSSQWGYDPAATTAALKNIRLSWVLGPSFVRAYQSLADQLVNIGLVSRNVNVAPIVASRFTVAAQKQLAAAKKSRKKRKK